MAVYREGYHIVNYIEFNTKIIEEGYLDEGLIMTKGDPVWNMVNQLVTWYGVEGSKRVLLSNKYCLKREMEIELMDEWAVSDGRKSIMEATDRYKVRVTKYKNKMWCSVVKCN